MKKTANGLKSLFLATALGFSSFAVANDASTPSNPPQEAPKDQSVTAIGIAVISKGNCPAGVLSTIVDPRRPTVIINVDPRVQSMMGFVDVLKDVAIEYAPKVTIPMTLVFLAPQKPEDITAPCWTSSFGDNLNVVTMFDGKPVMVGKLFDDMNPSKIDSIMSLSTLIQSAQMASSNYIRAKAQPKKPALAI